MLFNLFRSGFSQESILMVVLSVPAVLIALTFHEFSHGLVSYWLGDPTAKNHGRLTLNPIKHLDPIGFVCMLVVGFGWAKPVPFNSRYYKHPRRDTALTAAAGPIMNLLLAFVSVIGINCMELIDLTKVSETGFNVLNAIYLFFYVLANMNIFLAIFNLIPIPPFDGSKILFVFLPIKWYIAMAKYERIIMIVFYIVLFVGGFSNILSTVSGAVFYGMDWLIKLIPIFR